MPYDTNGNYSLPTIYYAISGTTINPSQHNTPLEDVQAALNRPLLRDGTAPMTGNLNANGNKITGMAKGTADTDAVTFAQLGGYATQEWSNNQFVGRGASVYDFTPLQLGINKSSGEIWASYTAADGTVKYAFAQQTGDYATNTALTQGLAGKQPTGDYATNTALQSEASSRSGADANLQDQVNNRVVKTGDEMTGTLFITGNTGGLVSQWNPGNVSSGQFVIYPGLSSIAQGRGGEFHCQLQEQVGINFRALMSLKFADGSWRYVKWGKNERINDSQYGDVAYVNDLGKYALLSQLPTDTNKIILAWSGYVGGGDQSIPFPRGVSFVDTVVVVCSKQASGNHASAIINVQGWDTSSVQVNTVWVGGSLQGNADVNYRAILVGNK